MLLFASISGLTAVLSVELMADRSMEAGGKTSETGPPGFSEGRKEQPQSVARMERAVGKNGTIPDQRRIWGNLGSTESGCSAVNSERGRGPI